MTSTSRTTAKKPLLAFRRTDWRDGVQFGECLVCHDSVAEPDAFCTHCGVRWELAVVKGERDPERGYADDRYHYEPWLIQVKYLPTTVFPDGSGWESVWCARGPFDAVRKLAEYRRQATRDDDDFVRKTFRALPLRVLRAQPDFDGGKHYIDLLHYGGADFEPRLP